MSSSNPSDEVSLSFEETNKLRVSLGLKPLRTAAVEKPRGEALVVAPTEGGQDTDALRARLAAAKRAREIQAAAKASKGLAHDDDGEDAPVDAASWVKRVRETGQVPLPPPLKKQKLAADPSGQYTSENLQGLKVATKIQDEGQILTLRDTGVLGDQEVIKLKIN
jgi:U4/U6.U5 tri-snRNP-associated protein 1